MAVTITNSGLYAFFNSAISGSTDLRQLVIKGAVPSVATIRDLNTVADLLAQSGVVEAAASGYARKTLSGVTLAENDTPDTVTLVAAAPTYAAVAAGETWLAVAFYIEGVNDAARTLVAVDQPASSQVTNGGDITAPALSITVSQA
jgi:hypothetical protein